MQRPAFVFLSQLFKFKVFQQINFTWTFFEKKHIIQFSHAFLQEIFKKNFQINFYVLAEEIIATKTAEAINLFTISVSKIFVGGQLTLSV